MMWSRIRAVIYTMIIVAGVVVTIHQLFFPSVQITLIDFMRDSLGPYLIIVAMGIVIIGWLYGAFLMIGRSSRKSNSALAIKSEVDLIDMQKREVRSLATMLLVGVAMWFAALVPNLMSHANLSVENIHGQFVGDLAWFLYILALPVTAVLAVVAVLFYSQNKYDKVIFLLRIPFFHLLAYLATAFIFYFMNV